MKLSITCVIVCLFVAAISAFPTNSELRSQKDEKSENVAVENVFVESAPLTVDTVTGIEQDAKKHEEQGTADVDEDDGDNTVQVEKHENEGLSEHTVVDEDEDVEDNVEEHEKLPETEETEHDTDEGHEESDEHKQTNEDVETEENEIEESDEADHTEEEDNEKTEGESSEDASEESDTGLENKEEADYESAGEENSDNHEEEEYSDNADAEKNDSGKVDISASHAGNEEGSEDTHSHNEDSAQGAHDDDDEDERDDKLGEEDSEEEKGGEVAEDYLTDESSEAPTEDITEKISETATEKTTEEALSSPTEHVADAEDDPTDESSKASSEAITDKVTEKATEVVPSNPTDASIEPPKVSPLVEKLDHILSLFEATIKNLEKEKNKGFKSLNKRLQNRFSKHVGDISTYTEYLQDDNGECVEKRREGLVALKDSTITQIKICSAQGIEDGAHILNDINKAKENLLKETVRPVSYLRKCIENEALCSAGRRKLFIEDIHALTAELQANHAKSTYKFIQAGAEAQNCINEIVNRSNTHALVYRHGDCDTE